MFAFYFTTSLLLFLVFAIYGVRKNILKKTVFIPVFGMIALVVALYFTIGF